MNMSRNQRLRQGHRDRTGRYAQVFPCYRCGTSAGEDYFSFNADTRDSLGNDWHDTALCLCKPCADYMLTLSPEAAWAETSNRWGKLPQGKPAAKPIDYTIYYETQERAMAPGIADGWPKIIAAPHTKNGRLVQLSEEQCRAIQKILYPDTKAQARADCEATAGLVSDGR